MCMYYSHGVDVSFCFASFWQGDLCVIIIIIAHLCALRYNVRSHDRFPGMRLALGHVIGYKCIYIGKHLLSIICIWSRGNRSMCGKT